MEYMMYVLQLETSTNSVVIGVYDTLGNTKSAVDKFIEKNPLFNRTHFFFDYKRVNADAEWNNQQEQVWI